MTEVIIGIDPGVNGGICALQGNKIILLERTPKIKTGKNRNEYDMYEMAKLIISVNNDAETKVFIEKVNAMPKQGVRSMFNFGKGFGIWMGICAGLKIPIAFVRPQDWKAKMLSGTDKSKGAAILRAKEFFPEVDLKPGRLIKDHDGLAEAILISLYGGTKEWA